MPGAKLDVNGNIKAEDGNGRNIGFASSVDNVFYRGMLSDTLTSEMS